MNEFHRFAGAVRRQFDEMAQTPLFEAGIDGDSLWSHYLASFPAGSNPIFRERTEHDCSCCRSFIRSVGAVVAIQNGAVTSIWDVAGLPEPYQRVADAMAARVKQHAIHDIFLTTFQKHGQEVSHEHKAGGPVLTWNHFFAAVPRKFVSSDVDAARGNARTTHDMLLRAVNELKTSALADVAALIADGNLYRGQELLRSVSDFATLQAECLAAKPEDRATVAWTKINHPVARFRNTVIGTLVEDLSAGMDIEDAVRRFEPKVAPQNYKRPKALITAGMVKAAMETIKELGIEASLERRHARLSDVSVANVLFVDNAVRGKMKGGIEGLLMDQVRPQAFDPSKAVPIGIESFVSTVLPKTKAVQVYLEGRLLRNFVSVTAPVHADAPPVFKWGNGFGWSYDGNAADSIKDKVKRAGGQVEGVAMRVSLAWHNYDDLDIHVIEPGGNHIYFGNRSDKLDVDMNVGPTTREPVENVRWVSAPRDGVYTVFVHNFTKRESIDVGFAVEIEGSNGLTTLTYQKALASREERQVCGIVMDRGRMTIDPRPGFALGTPSIDHWGLKTQTLVRADSIVLSPNHWDQPVGNKHWFFILDGCRNPLPTRWIYNEFLTSRLDQHRKVFEILGDKTKCQVADEQLSGVGFSAGRGDQVTVVAMGPDLRKTYSIQF